MLTIILFVLLAFGLFQLFADSTSTPYAPAAKAILARRPVQLKKSQLAVAALARKIEPYITLEPIQRIQLKDLLEQLNYNYTPEYYHSLLISRAAINSVYTSILVVFSIPIGIIAMVAMFFACYSKENKKLKQQQALHRQAIEKELPQFASTICQSLRSTRDIAAILTTYRKICGPVLAGEIERTLNDILTGNTSQALKAFEGRINSPKLSQITRGLQAVLRGDGNQTTYFDILAETLKKSQSEALEKELLNRPKQLYPYLGFLFIGLVLMIMASLGTDMVVQMQNLF